MNHASGTRAYHTRSLCPASCFMIQGSCCMILFGVPADGMPEQRNVARRGDIPGVDLPHGFLDQFFPCWAALKPVLNATHDCGKHESRVVRREAEAVSAIRSRVVIKNRVL